MEHRKSLLLCTAFLYSVGLVAADMGSIGAGGAIFLAGIMLWPFLIGIIALIFIVWMILRKIKKKKSANLKK